MADLGQTSSLADLMGNSNVDELPAMTFKTGGAVVGATLTQTLTNKTLTAPAINGGTITGATVTGSISSNILRCTTQVDATSTTLANITGLTGFALVAGATYDFELDLYVTAGSTGGHKVAFNLTTATLTAINYNSWGYTATAVAVSNGTTTTNQTSLITSATAFTNIIIRGTVVVNAAGTLDVQYAENNAAGTSSVLVGSTARFTRIA